MNYAISKNSLNYYLEVTNTFADILVMRIICRGGCIIEKSCNIYQHLVNTVVISLEKLSLENRQSCMQKITAYNYEKVDSSKQRIDLETHQHNYSSSSQDSGHQNQYRKLRIFLFSLKLNESAFLVVDPEKPIFLKWSLNDFHAGAVIDTLECCAGIKKFMAE